MKQDVEEVQLSSRKSDAGRDRNVTPTKTDAMCGLSVCSIGSRPVAVTNRSYDGRGGRRGGRLAVFARLRVENPLKSRQFFDKKGLEGKRLYVNYETNPIGGLYT